MIYVQAKRWQGSVGSEPVLNFVGALTAKGVEKVGQRLALAPFWWPLGAAALLV